MYAEILSSVDIGVVIVEEAAEILEAHLLTSLPVRPKHLVMIGDHKQLRPKVSNFKLTVEAKQGHAFNRSMMERLVLSGYPHTTLLTQHRMRPEISALIAPVYPGLADASSTLTHPPLKGVQSSVRSSTISSLKKLSVQESRYPRQTCTRCGWLCRLSSIYISKGTALSKWSCLPLTLVSLWSCNERSV